MRQELRHIIRTGSRWNLLALVVALLFMTGCNSGEEEQNENGNQPTVLQIYVYSPEAPIVTRGLAAGGSMPVVTRGNTGDVNTIGNEGALHSMQIWVFTHGAGELVGYLSADEQKIAQLQGVFQMMVGDALTSDSKVDVFVLANVTADNCNVTLDRSSNYNTVKTACLSKTTAADPFGVTTPTTAVPTDGLPMSGVLLDQQVSGSAPVLHIGTDDAIATVKLARMVSKVRFVFCKGKPAEDQNEKTVKITGISLAGSMIPTEEYLFLEAPYDRTNYHVGSNYDEAVATLLASTDAPLVLPSIDDPTKYSYHDQTGQVYEDLIDEGLRSDLSADSPKTAELVGKGPFYFRESDKQLTGTINYTVAEIEQDVEQTPVSKSARFTMSAKGDFSRNHSWIVYAFYSASGLEIVSVTTEAWNNKGKSDHEVYNW